MLIFDFTYAILIIIIICYRGHVLMAKSIYTYYKERLIEIGGNNKCLYLKNVNKKSAYDLGKIFEARDDKVSEFVKFLWSDGKYPLTVIGTEEKTAILQNLNVQTKLEAKEQKEPLVGEDAEKYERKLPKLSKRFTPMKNS